MKKRFYSLILSILLVLSVIPFCSFSEEPISEVVNPFIDISENDYFYDYVIELYKNGYIAGTSENTYSPLGNLTRAELVQMLFNVNKKLEISSVQPGLNPFTDVAAGAWYEEAVTWAYYNRVTSGTGEGLFSPDRTITREEAATLIYNFFFEGEFDNTDAISSFADADTVSQFAYEAVSYNAAQKIIIGYPDGSFKPKDSIDRAMASAMLCNAVNVYTGV